MMEVLSVSAMQPVDKRFYVKFNAPPGMRDDEGRSQIYLSPWDVAKEVMLANLFRALSNEFKVPETYAVVNEQEGQCYYGVASEEIPGALAYEQVNTDPAAFSLANVKGLPELIAVAVFLQDWDVVGQDFRNVRFLPLADGGYQIVKFDFGAASLPNNQEDYDNEIEYDAVYTGEGILLTQGLIEDYSTDGVLARKQNFKLQDLAEIITENKELQQKFDNMVKKYLDLSEIKLQALAASQAFFEAGFISVEARRISFNMLNQRQVKLKDKLKRLSKPKDQDSALPAISSAMPVIIESSSFSPKDANTMVSAESAQAYSLVELKPFAGKIKTNNNEAQPQVPEAGMGYIGAGITSSKPKASERSGGAMWMRWIINFFINLFNFLLDSASEETHQSFNKVNKDEIKHSQKKLSFAPTSRLFSTKKATRKISAHHDAISSVFSRR